MRLAFFLGNTRGVAPPAQLAGALLLAAGTALAADAVPEWVRQTAEMPTPSYSAKVNSVVLFHEEALTVDPDGHRVMREREAVKLLQSGGDKLTATRYYDGKSGRIRDFQGWLVAFKPT